MYYKNFMGIPHPEFLFKTDDQCFKIRDQPKYILLIRRENYISFLFQSRVYKREDLSTRWHFMDHLSIIIFQSRWC
jgi:hypothetical protein